MFNYDKKFIVCLLGPTASGKTQLAIELLQHFPFEIISVDSAMIYRGMDIGTSKPDRITLEKAPHRLIDICDPHESYSAAQFCEDVVKEIKDVFHRGNIPLLVGGTMLYFRAFQNGLSELPSANQEIRDRLTAEGLANGWPALHAQLAAIDPVAATRIHHHDSQRIQRALEVYQLTGKSLTQWQIENKSKINPFTIYTLGLIPSNRKNLHMRIAERFQIMLSQGFVQEVETFFHRHDLSLDLPSMRSVGYRQIWEYLQGSHDYQTMVEKGIAATRQLAKRQLTWLKSWDNLICMESDAPNIKNQLITRIITFLSL